MDAYEAGRQDVLTGEVRWDYSYIWPDAYRRGVIDATAEVVA